MNGIQKMGETLIKIFDSYDKEFKRKSKTEKGKMFTNINLIMVICAWLGIILSLGYYFYFTSRIL